MSERGAEMKKIETEQDVIAIIDDVVSAVQSAPETKKFFSEALRRLGDFRNVLENVETRIAIIGITSSGKSTLMNAVLGGNLLPTRVAPSSSKQVICGWDEKQEGEIVFAPETGKKPRKVTGGADAILRELEKYGDEKFNPGNCEGVDEIRVHAPGFRFNHDLVIIDTPGLDAYGLDQHKEVTMKLVLPTVDMILFLTNVKCDSDAANLGFIDNVTTDSKPLVIVQNKIDSIEAKYTKNGIEKTVEEVKHDHLVRIQRLVSHAKKESVRRAPIVQVSAKAPTWAKSNLEELGKVLDEQIRLNSQFRVVRRARRLALFLEEMATALKPKLASVASAAEAQKQNERTVAKWQENVDAAQAQWQTITDEIKKRLTQITDIRNSLMEEIDKEYKRWDSSSTIGRWACKFTQNMGFTFKNTEHLSASVQDGKKQLEVVVHNINVYFSSSITDIQTAIQRCCHDLKLDARQVIRSAPFRSQHISISNCQETKTEKYTVQVKDSGVGGFLKRWSFFGLGGAMGWGYHDETRERTKVVYNIGKLVKEIESSYKTFMEAFKQQAEVFSSNTRFAMDVLVREMESRQEAVKEQSRQVLPMALCKKLLENINETTREIKETTAQEARVENAVVRQAAMASTSLSAGTCPAVVLKAEQFAHRVSFDLAAGLTDAIVSRAGKQKVVVCGWDGNKVKLFREWFFREEAAVAVVDFSKGDATLSTSDATVFLLCNAEQVGSFKGKLLGSGARTEYLKSAAQKGAIVWVMDSVREHVVNGAGDALIEAFTEMMKLAREFMEGKPIFDVMACDREIYWTVLLHELYFNHAIFESETARQVFVDEMSNVFRLSNERRHATGKYVAQFSNSRKEC